MSVVLITGCSSGSGPGGAQAGWAGLIRTTVGY